MDVPEWLKFLLSDASALQLVFWIIAIGALIAVIVKLWPSLSQFVNIMNAVTGLPVFIAETKVTLDKTGATLAAQDLMLQSQDVAIKSIYHETHNNNGSSIKDSQDRTEKLVKEEVLPRLKTLADADDQLRKDLEDTRPTKEKP